MSPPTVVPRRAGVDLRDGASSAFGTFGELLQGSLPDGVDFLVTFPIDRYSHARFRLEPDGPLRVYPSHKWKSLRLAKYLMDLAGAPGGGALILDSDLPIGKGLASSSADLVATARAVAGVLGLPTTATAMLEWLRPIEPTDGVMYPGVVAFDHRLVRLRAFLGQLPSLTVVAIDEGGHVDTIAFNRGHKPFRAGERAEYGELLDRIAAAVAAEDLTEVGAVATRSAQLNQRFAPKRHLDQLLNICADNGGLGVVCAHSGTMLGVLLSTTDVDYPRRLAQITASCSALSAQVSVFHSLSFSQNGLAHAL